MLTLAFAVGEAPSTRSGRKVNEWRDECGALIAQAFSWEDLHGIDWPGLGMFVFSGTSHEVWVWPEPDAKREVIIDAFCRMLQPVILQALGWQALHASAALGPAGLLAFCGRKGSGKSTLAFAMQQAGWWQFADDTVVLRLDTDHVTTCALPFTPGLRPLSRGHFAAHPLPRSLNQQFENVPLTGVFLLEQNSGLTSPRVSLMQRAQAFSGLLTYAHCFDVGNSTHIRQLVSDYLGIAARVRAFTLEYPPNFQRLKQLTNVVAEAATSIDLTAALKSAARHVALVP